MTDTTSPEELPRPRIRIGAALWGLVLVVLGASALWIGLDRARRTDALEAVLALDGLGWTVVAVTLVGGTLTLIALAAVIRRVQTRRR